MPLSAKTNTALLRVLCATAFAFAAWVPSSAEERPEITTGSRVRSAFAGDPPR
jgi:hypothetical protein